MGSGKANPFLFVTSSVKRPLANGEGGRKLDRSKEEKREGGRIRKREF